DRATADPDNYDRYGQLKFYNLGITRSSFNKLGIRNQLNTAFLPFKLKDDASDRLLVTWDVGRPHEIDPETLETLTPVGMNENWSELSASQQKMPFKNMMSSAHPVFDFTAERFYTLNVGKSLWTIMGLPRSINVRIKENSQALKSVWNQFTKDRNLNFTKSFSNILILMYSSILFALKIFISVAGIFVGLFSAFTGGYDFVHLLAWDGKKVGISKKWNIVLPYNRPLSIGQTVHQMAITEDYIVFAETSFKFSLENILPFRRSSLLSSFIVFITDFLNYPQYPSTNLYIVKKSDLAVETPSLFTRFTNLFDRSAFRRLPKVVAKKVEVKPEFSHFVLEYENPNGQIVAHASHLAASDVAEYIRIYDRSAYDNRDTDELGNIYDNPRDIYDDSELTYRIQQIAGNIVSPTDISRIGRFVIDVELGEVIDQQLFPNQKDDQDEINRQLAAHKKDPENNQIDFKYLLPWSTAFYIYSDLRPTKQLTDIFWNSWGAWPDTLTVRALEAYRDYPERLVELKNVIDLTYEGVPSSLCHLQMIRDSNGQTKVQLNEGNCFQFDKRNLGTSSQFVPRPNAKDQADGYIVCAVLTGDSFLSQSTPPDPKWSENSEIWIFDAKKLKDGPLRKLSHPKLNVGFSFHTTWMAEVKSPERRLAYNTREDYQDLVEEIKT
ncbi:MAG: carotenoid oxygenase family protein, partial [Cyanobacteria bacterium J06600_6]